MRPRCCFRYLTFFGINIALVLLFRVALGLLRRLRSRHRRQNRSGNRSLHSTLMHWSSRHRTRSPVSVAISVAVPIPAVSVARRRPAWFRLVTQTAALSARQNLALINPAFDADHAVRRVGFAEPVIDIGAQRVQRKLALQIPF